MVSRQKQIEFVQRRRARRCLRAMLVCLLAGFVYLAPLQADTVMLRNGQTVTGQIVGQTRTRIDIKTANGIQRIQKADVRRVVFDRDEATGEDVAARKAREEAERRRQRLEAERRRKAAEQERLQAEAEAKAQAEAERQEALKQQQAEEQQTFDASITTGGALWRSAILPGWGQYYQGRTGAAFGYGAAFLATGAYAASAQSEASSAQAAYDSAASNLSLSVVYLGAALPLVDPDLLLRSQLFGLQFYTFLERDAAYARAESASSRFRLSAALLGAVYVMNLVDVVLFHPGENTSLGVYAGPGTAGMRWQFRF